MRRIIYTTNAIEALNSKLRRAVWTRGHFPGNDAAMKLLYFVLTGEIPRSCKAATVNAVARELSRDAIYVDGS